MKMARRSVVSRGRAVRLRFRAPFRLQDAQAVEPPEVEFEPTSRTISASGYRSRRFACRVSTFCRRRGSRFRTRYESTS